MVWVIRGVGRSWCGSFVVWVVRGVVNHVVVKPWDEEIVVWLHHGVGCLHTRGLMARRR